jgi:DNA-binding SARP family transcriptional activator
MEQAPFEITVLGGFAVRRGGVAMPAPGGVPGQAVKVIATLGPMHAEALSDVLWGAHAAGRTRLRNVLARIRTTLGPLLVRAEEVIMLPPGTQVDADAFEALARRALQTTDGDGGGIPLALAAYERYTGELLPQDRYHDWCATRRERLRRQFIGVTERLAHDAAHAGRVEQAVNLLEEIIELEPYDEDRYLDLAEILLSAGRRGRALESCRRAREACARLDVPVPERCTALEQQARDGSMRIDR